MVRGCERGGWGEFVTESTLRSVLDAHIEILSVYVNQLNVLKAGRQTDNSQNRTKHKITMVGQTQPGWYRASPHPRVEHPQGRGMGGQVPRSSHAADQRCLLPGNGTRGMWIREEVNLLPPPRGGGGYIN